MSEPRRQIGRYAMYGALASGGMATVHLGRLAGAAGFARTVAIKALRPQYAEDAEFVSMFIDEVRLAARIHHPNVVATLDVIASDNELFSVMDYVHGETLARLVRVATARKHAIPLSIASAIMRDVLNGLHAAHQTTDENGAPLGVVHRDVSPQNVMVGTDGVARVLDFGVAKAAGRIQTTREGQLKGKLAYMAPEQLHGNVTQLTDVFASAVVLWEVIVGEKLFTGNEGEIVMSIVQASVEHPRTKRDDVPVALDDVVMRGLAREPAERFPSAKEMATALEAACQPATTAEVAAWVTDLASDTLDARQSVIREMESGITDTITTPTFPVPHDGTGTDMSRDALRVSRAPRQPSRAVLVSLAAAVVLIAGVATWMARPPRVASSAAPTTTTSSSSPLPTETSSASAAMSASPPPTSETKPVTRPSHRPVTRPPPTAVPRTTSAPDHI